MNENAQPTVLVTGAEGFIGSHLTELLVQEGFEVKALTMYNSVQLLGVAGRCRSRHSSQSLER